MNCTEHFSTKRVHRRNYTSNISCPKLINDRFWIFVI
jgi:hypothetical protein